MILTPFKTSFIVTPSPNYNYLRCFLTKVVKRTRDTQHIVNHLNTNTTGSGFEVNFTMIDF